MLMCRWKMSHNHQQSSVLPLLSWPTQPVRHNTTTNVKNDQIRSPDRQDDRLVARINSTVRSSKDWVQRADELKDEAGELMSSRSPSYEVWQDRRISRLLEEHSHSVTMALKKLSAEVAVSIDWVVQIVEILLRYSRILSLYPPQIRFERKQRIFLYPSLIHPPLRATMNKVSCTDLPFKAIFLQNEDIQGLCLRTPSVVLPWTQHIYDLGMQIPWKKHVVTPALPS